MYVHVLSHQDLCTDQQNYVWFAGYLWKAAGVYKHVQWTGEEMCISGDRKLPQTGETDTLS